MIPFSRCIGFPALSATAFAATAAFGQSAIEDVLGGPVVACSGAIAWTEGDSGTQRVEPMRLAARDLDGADGIALFLTGDDIGADSVWSCMDGACTSTRTLRSTVTVNALRLRHEADLGSGEAIYGLTAVFVGINARETPIEVADAHGTGSFICERPLPQSLLPTAE